MNDTIRKQLRELQEKILTSNAKDPATRDLSSPSHDFREIEEHAARLCGLVATQLRPTEKVLGMVRITSPAHRHPAKVVGDLVGLLRERGWICE